MIGFRNLFSKRFSNFMAREWMEYPTWCLLVVFQIIKDLEAANMGPFVGLITEEK